MSVQEIEKAIVELPPAEVKELAAWISNLCIPEPAVRPRLSEAEFTPVICTPDAFDPLTDEEMEEFGFS